MQTKSFFFIAAIASLMLAASCNELEKQNASAGSLTVKVTDGILTKVASGTTAETYETQLNSVQILLFDSNGNLYRYANPSSMSDGGTQSFENVNAATYTVVAVANAPDLSSVSSLSALEALSVELGDNSTDAATGFRMYGSATATVTGGNTTANPATCEVSLSRYTARVKLIRVTNSLPAALGGLTVDNVMLINVLTSWNYAGSGDASTWGNLAGRKDGSVISSAADATCADLTFNGTGFSVAQGSPVTPDYKFYSFPNGSTSAETGASATEGPVRLVVTATFDGRTYYYPVTIPGIARNTSYDVMLTITGPGSDDPNTPVAKGNIQATIIVSPWISGGEAYEETI